MFIIYQDLTKLSSWPFPCFLVFSWSRFHHIWPQPVQRLTSSNWSLMFSRNQRAC